LFAAGLAAELFIATLGTALKGIHGKGAPFIPGFGSPAHIGRLFLTKYLFPFEAASILLLVAAVGAVVLARPRRGLGAGPPQPAVDPALPRADAQRRQSGADRLRAHVGRRVRAGIRAGRDGGGGQRGGGGAGPDRGPVPPPAAGGRRRAL